MNWMAHVPRLTPADAEVAARELFDVDARAAPLASERDQNFLLTASGGARYVLKIANGSEPRDAIEAQAAVLRHLAPTALAPRLVPTRAGDDLGEFDGHLMRLVTFLDGRPLGETSRQTPALLQDLGRLVATIDRALSTFDHPALRRPFHWDLARASGTIREHLPRVADPRLRNLVASVLSTYEATVAPKLLALPQSAIHNDANDHNVIVDPQSQRVVGLIDFGDMVYSQTVGGLAVAMAYAALGKRDPLAAAATVAQGYQTVRPLADDERTVLFGLMCTRLALSVCLAATQQAARPDDAYLGISQAGIRETLPVLAAIDPQRATARLFETCAAPPARVDALLARRRARLGANVRLSYGSHPLQAVRGWMQYLYDESGRRYIDAYNNVPHVGHCHPRVVEAVVEQLATLNTNTRYLHEGVLDYADALAARFPAPLGVCFFTASGSEANELALRLARAHTRQRDLIVMEGAYHGHTTTLIDISPYKHAGPGGEGAPDWVHVSPMPDVYRGSYRAGEADAGLKYARHVGAIVDRLRTSGRGLCGYIAETCPSVGGQIIPPDGFFPEVYRLVREAGGVCIADEVQTGFGRLGTEFWAFERFGVVPDIVVLGKPIANGYPMGAVVTTPDIVASFDTGMEFFSTFGGSTAACAAALATLQVTEAEGLQAHARAVGDRLLAGFRGLAARHDLIGDVRGSGLFIGVELVRDRRTLAPAAAQAEAAVNRLRELGVLSGTDGPLHNVIKIRGPLPLSAADADAIVQALDQALSES